MKVAIGSDHRGYQLKSELIEFLKAAGHEVTDVGPESDDSCDYPVYGYAVADLVAKEECDRGIVICNTGIGISITANKVDGVRAALCCDKSAASAARLHNNANVVAFGAAYVDSQQAKEIVTEFLDTVFEGGRHQRRIDQITEIEKGSFRK